MGWPDRLYKTRKWEKRREQQRREHPLCQLCEAEGKITIMRYAHHIHEHRPGAEEWEFWLGPLMSLCADHHLIVHGRAPTLPFRRDIGPDGFPLDPRHPFYTQEHRWKPTAK